MNWDKYLARGVLVLDQKISVENTHAISSPESRFNSLQSKLNSFFKNQGLSSFSAKVAISFLESHLMSNGEENLHHVIQYLIRSISTNISLKYSQDFDLYQRKCPNLIPDLKSQPFWNVNEIPGIKVIEENFEIIREEFMALRNVCNSFQPYRAPASASIHRTIDNLGQVATNQGDWNVCYLYLHGMDFQNTLQHCPQTAKIIKEIPRQYNHSLFSALAPHTHIAPHNGPTNKKLRCQLPLLVPPGDLCTLTVAHQRRVLEEGKCLVFDDSFEHEASNASVFPRVILIVDIWHPDLSDNEIKFLSFLDKCQINSIRKMINDEKMKETQSLHCSTENIDNIKENDNFMTVIERARDVSVQTKDIWGL